MFGHNPVMKPETHDGSVLKVVKIFPTIQGEGPFAGHPSIFIRLHGCHLKCWFCDTEFSNPEDPEMPVEDILGAVQSLAEKGRYKLVVITGGEPTRQPLGKLIAALIEAGFLIQIETAGSFWQECLRNTDVHIIVSPKTGMVHQEIQWLARAYKYVISFANYSKDDGLPTASTQQKGMAANIFRPDPSVQKVVKVPIYLSPMDEYDEGKNKANRSLVARLAQKHGYIAGLQLHKFMGVE